MMDESTKPAEQPDEPGTSGGSDDDDQDGCQLIDLLRAYGRNFDHEGRLIDRRDEGDSTPSK